VRRGDGSASRSAGAFGDAAGSGNEPAAPAVARRVSDPIPTQVAVPGGARARPAAGPPRRPVVEVAGLTVRYGDTVAVDAVDLAVPEGELTVLVGASGCGKTSLLRAVAGFEVPAAGEVRIDGRTVVGPGTWVPPERRRVAMVFQEGALFPHRTVEGNVLYGLSALPRRERRQRARQALERVGMSELADRFPDQLSGGQQQRVALARALAPEPRLILLDEPFASLDAALRVRLREEVRQILAAAGATALMVTHDQAEALSVADHLVVMEAGRVIQAGRPDEVYRRPATAGVATFLGEGQLVPCRVAGGRLISPLGALEAPAGLAGAGHLLVRPEDIALLPGTGGSGLGGTGCGGRVVRRQFFGHDLLDEVELAEGLRLQVRLLSSVDHPVGAAVRLVLRPNDYRFFPAPPAPPAVVHFGS
jgi:iron(III) transport system ATP-binding protein